MKESTTPESVQNSSVFNSSSFYDVTSSVDPTTPRNSITNNDSSDNAISNDIDDFGESTPDNDFNKVTTPQSVTISSTSDLMEKELQFMNEQCEREKEGYFFGVSIQTFNTLRHT